MDLFKFKNKTSGVPKSTTIDNAEGKVSVVTMMREFVAGDILLKETIQKKFLFVLLLVVLSLVYVNNRFLYERQLRELNKLKIEVDDMHYRSLVASKELKQAGRRTMILKALRERGSNLEEATEPIVIIKD